PRAAARAAPRVHQAEGPRQDRTRPDGRDPARGVVPLHVRADRPRASGLQGPDAAVRGVRRERSLPVEPGLAAGRDERPGRFAPAPGAPQTPALLLGKATPHAGVLTRRHRPFETLRAN